MCATRSLGNGTVSEYSNGNDRSSSTATIESLIFNHEWQKCCPLPCVSENDGALRRSCFVEQHNTARKKNSAQISNETTPNRYAYKFESTSTSASMSDVHSDKGGEMFSARDEPAAHDEELPTYDSAAGDTGNSGPTPSGIEHNDDGREHEHGSYVHSAQVAAARGTTFMSKAFDDAFARVNLATDTLLLEDADFDVSFGFCSLRACTVRSDHHQQLASACFFLFCENAACDRQTADAFEWTFKKHRIYFLFIYLFI